MELCPACNGSGQKNVKVKSAIPGATIFELSACKTCRGNGKVARTVCSHCSGTRVVEVVQGYSVVVPKGAPEGHEIVFPGEADESVGGGEAGDMIFRVVVGDEAGWRREGSELFWTELIDADEVSCLFP